MTDNEIIKALEHCRDNGCAGCPLEFMEDDRGCMTEWLALINRQKAEIDRFKKHIVFEIESAYDRGKKAAVKEFAERLKGHRDGDYIFISTKLLDNHVNEMVGADNAERT